LENPLHHFELHTIIPLELFGIDISINQAVVMMWLVCAAVFFFFWVAGRSGRLIPTKFQSMVEVGVEFLRGMILDNMGEKGMRFFPFIATLFFFILFSNLLGLIPGAYTVTSQVMVNGLLALVVFVLSVVAGIVLHGFHYLSIFVPSGTPWWLMPVMIPVELISQLARPMTLAVRLFANMTAGHTVINVLLGLVLMGGVLLGWLPLGFTVAIYALELLVAFIQAYIFTVLTTVYIGDAIRLQH
jgi:F-type H+-transporting ATPase subunit a